MGNIKLENKVSDKEILEKNQIFLKEVKKVLKSINGEIALVQHICFGRFALTHGLIHGLMQYEDKKTLRKIHGDKKREYGYLRIGESTMAWLNQGIFQTERDSNQGLPFGYNDCEIGRIISCKKRIIFEDEELMEIWNKDYSEWKQKHSQKGKNGFMEVNHISNLLHAYGVKS